MYRVLTGGDFEPLKTAEDLHAWRERETMFVTLVDRATRRLSRDARVLPMSTHAASGVRYTRRYVAHQRGDKRTYFSVGVRSPFDGHTTPVWLRFDRKWAPLTAIRSALAASTLAGRCIQDERQIWIPLAVPMGADGDAIVQSLVSQVEEIERAAFAH